MWYAWPFPADGRRKFFVTPFQKAQALPDDVSIVVCGLKLCKNRDWYFRKLILQYLV
jgi:hypothetical protein